VTGKAPLNGPLPVTGPELPYPCSPFPLLLHILAVRSWLSVPFLSRNGPYHLPDPESSVTGLLYGYETVQSWSRLRSLFPVFPISGVPGVPGTPRYWFLSDTEATRLR